MPDRVCVFAPATVANLGPGFDILGMALAEPGDIIIARRTSQPGTVIKDIKGEDGRLSSNPTENTASIAAEYVRHQIAPSAGIALEINKGLPLASGLGSSAASAVGGAVAVNALFGNPLRREDLLPAVLEAEATVSGRHADNVAPCLMGGIVLVADTSPSSLFCLEVHSAICSLWLVLVTPHVEVPTVEARAVLPKTISLPTMVHQTSAATQLVYAILTGNVALFARALMQDEVVEPARRHLVPHFAQVRQTALSQGALAAIISGAGPTICIVVPHELAAISIAETVAAIYADHGIGSYQWITKLSPRGAHVIPGRG